jgi:hypothetical protein
MVVADTGSGSAGVGGLGPQQAHQLVQRSLRHATHELFRRVPVLRLGTARALEAAHMR